VHHPRLVVLLTVCVAMASSAPAEEIETLGSIRFLPSSGAGLAEAGTLRIGFRCVERDGVICFKTEHGRHLRFEEGTRGFEVTDQAQGGATVQNLDYIEVPLSVETAGRYQVWYRAFFPAPGNWLHFEAMDDGETITNTDNPKRPDLTGKWVWVKGPVYELSKGEHVWKLNGWRGGAKLDRLVFARDPQLVPTGLGPPLTVKLAARDAHFASGELAPGAKRWGRIHWTQAGKGGVKCFVSADAKTWTEVRNGAAVAPIVSGPSLYVQFALAASAAETSPLVQSIRLEYEPDPGAWKVLENDVARLVFTDRGLRDIVAKRSGTSYRAAGTATDFFHIKVKKPGYGPETELRASRDSNSRRIELRDGVLHGEYRFLDGKLTVRPIVELDAGGVSRWRLHIRNDTDMEVTSVRYPILRSAVVGDSGRDDILIVNSVWGQMIRNPAQWKQRYPTTPLMRWMDLYDAAGGGVYLADHHTNFASFNDVAMYVSASEDGSAVDLSLQKFLRVAAGSERVLDHYAVAVHDGDWHAAADIYRDAVVRHLRKPHYPDWVRACDGWNDSCAFWPGYGFNILQRFGELAHEDGLPFMHGSRMAASSCIAGYGGFWPQPTTAAGSIQELRQYFDEIREMGGDTNFYIAWNLHSPTQCLDRPRVCAYAPRTSFPRDTKFYDLPWYEENASRPHDGKITDVKPDDDLRARGRMCPGARGWQEYLDYWTRKYVGDYHCYIYYDCTSIGIAYGLAGMCQNLEHDHDDYGVYYRETTRLLERMHRIAREIDPDFVCSGEGCNDITGQTGIVHLASGVVNRCEIFQYTVPDQIVLNGNLNSGTRERLGGIERFNHIFLTGARFDGLPHRQHGAQAKLATSAEYARDLLELRRRTKQYLYPARFLDTVGLTLLQTDGTPLANPPIRPDTIEQIAPVDGAQAKWFKLETPEERVWLVNTLNTEGREDLRVALTASQVGKPNAAWVVPLGGGPKPVALRQEEGAWCCPMPPDKLATLMLVERAAPSVRIDGPGVTVTCPGETLDIGVRLVNLEPTPETATLRWAAPAGCRAGDPVRVALAPGKVEKMTVPITIGGTAAKRRYDMPLLVEWRGRTARIYHRLSVTDAVIVRLRDDDQKNPVVVLRNLSSKRHAVKGSVKVDPPLSPTETTIDCVLEPHQSLVKTVEVNGWDDVRLPLRARLALQDESGRRMEKSMILYPFVPNGDFETDVVGDGYPEWWAAWTRRGPAGGRKRIRLDSSKAASGRSSLRLDPDPKAADGGFTVAQPMVARLKADREYIASVDIFRPKDTPDVYLQVERLRLGDKGVQTGTWQHFEGRFTFANPTQFPDHNPAYDWVRWLRLYNRSGSPAWFDNLTIREAK